MSFSKIRFSLTLVDNYNHLMLGFSLVNYHPRATIISTIKLPKNNHQTKFCEDLDSSSNFRSTFWYAISFAP